MKLVTFAHQNKTRFGALVSRGGKDFVLDLNRAQPSLPDDLLAFLNAGEPAWKLAQQAIATPDEKSLVNKADVTLLAPLLRPGKIICIGHNYHGHTSATPPTHPDIFAKFVNVVNALNRPIIIPRESTQVDYEGELGVVIGKRARRIPQERALEFVAGYTIFNDVSARDLQKRQSQWTFGKTPDTFGPMGPALVTQDEVGDVGNLELSLWVNDELRQHASTSDLIFSVPFLVSYISELITLEPGDLISTGTPSGTGGSQKPPCFLKPGDVVKIRIDKVGELSNPVAAES